MAISQNRAGTVNPRYIRNDTIKLAPDHSSIYRRARSKAPRGDKNVKKYCGKITRNISTDLFPLNDCARRLQVGRPSGWRCGLFQNYCRQSSYLTYSRAVHYKSYEDDSALGSVWNWRRHPNSLEHISTCTHSKSQDGEMFQEALNFINFKM